jgi:ABC-type ATPase with predicted acetyltransferase domain
VYSFSAPVTFGRARVWKDSIRMLQGEMSTISRVVIHPKYRSSGLGAKIIAETLCQADQAAT